MYIAHTKKNEEEKKKCQKMNSFQFIFLSGKCWISSSFFLLWLDLINYKRVHTPTWIYHIAKPGWASTLYTKIYECILRDHICVEACSYNFSISIIIYHRSEINWRAWKDFFPFLLRKCSSEWHDNFWIYLFLYYSDGCYFLPFQWSHLCYSFGLFGQVKEEIK